MPDAMHIALPALRIAAPHRSTIGGCAARAWRKSTFIIRAGGAGQ